MTAPTERRGTGMMEYEVVHADSPEAALQAMRDWAAAGLHDPDQVRASNAAHVRAALAGAYARMDPARLWRKDPDKVETFGPLMKAHPEHFVTMYFGENSHYAIMREWLEAFDRMEIARAGTPPDLAAFGMWAERCGRLQERLFWRAGVDPATRDTRESLAVTGRKVRLAQKAGGAEGNRKHASDREKRFVRMRDLVPSLGVEKAARQCEAEGLGGWQGIRRQWHRHA